MTTVPLTSLRRASDLDAANTDVKNFPAHAPLAGLTNLAAHAAHAALAVRATPTTTIADSSAFAALTTAHAALAAFANLDYHLGVAALVATFRKAAHRIASGL